MPKDTLYSRERPIPPFEFNAEVTDVFDDMVTRSIPFYKQAQAQILALLQKNPKPIRRIYDLGCSTGNLIFFLAEQGNDPSIEFIGIDGSKSMIEKCKERLKQMHFKGKFSFRREDLRETGFENADVVILNYVLQFLPLDQRKSLLKKIYADLNPGGLLILSEKTKPDSQKIDETFVKIHEGFKEKHHYSQLEISQKRKALETVLIPLSLRKNLELLEETGFQNPEPFLLWHNFVSILAIK